MVCHLEHGECGLRLAQRLRHLDGDAIADPAHAAFGERDLAAAHADDGQWRELRWVATNVCIALVGLFSCYLSVFFLLGHYFTRFAVTAGVFAVCALILHRTWYSRLEQHESVDFHI